MPEKNNSSQQFLTYKGKPLVRMGNTIYYGDMRDKFVVMMTILSNHDEDGMNFADKVMIQLLSTDASKPVTERFIKKSEKTGLYNALDIASIWLERALSESGQA